jgi:hypothetical protein
VQQRHGEGSVDQLLNLATRPLSGVHGLVTSSINSVGALASTISGSSSDQRGRSRSHDRTVSTGQQHSESKPS